MLASAIPQHEQEFRTNGIDAAGKKHLLSPLTVPIPGESGQLQVIRAQPASGDTSFYYSETPAKRRIVLHFTAGFLKGDIASLTRPHFHVSVPFVVARDGTIYNLWSSAFWSYHLGPNSVGGNEAMSKSSVGIEISNVGPLRKKGSQLLLSNPGVDSVYCNDTEFQYFQLIPFRSFNYYATYTDAQYQSVITLLRYLTAQYQIPRQFLPPDQIFVTTGAVAQFSGITSHINYRTDKFDIGPAFDWQRIMNAL